MTNKLIIAAAGSGKTKHLVEKALEIKNGNVLITTYTLENLRIIREKLENEIKNQTGSTEIPNNINIKTWYSFLFQDGVRPYYNCLLDNNVRSIDGIFFTERRSARYIAKDNPLKYYLKQSVIFSDKLSEFAYECNKKSYNAVVNRIASIYPHILIDEAQDFAGYDYEFLSEIFKNPINMLLVCDPRQKAYSTNPSNKNSRFKDIHQYIKNKKELNEIVEIDNTSLNTNYRSIDKICDMANKIYPDYPPINSDIGNECSEHNGVFLIKKDDIEQYLNDIKPVQLMYKNAHKNSMPDRPCYNFGKVKGDEFDHVLIHPTKKMLDWLCGNDDIFKKDKTKETQSKFYIAVTRAKYSVGILLKNNPKKYAEEIIPLHKFIEIYNPDSNMLL